MDVRYWIGCDVVVFLFFIFFWARNTRVHEEYIFIFILFLVHRCIAPFPILFLLSSFHGFSAIPIKTLTATGMFLIIFGVVEKPSYERPSLFSRWQSFMLNALAVEEHKRPSFRFNILLLFSHAAPWALISPAFARATAFPGTPVMVVCTELAAILGTVPFLVQVDENTDRSRLQPELRLSSELLINVAPVEPGTCTGVSQVLELHVL
mmetsp:Transcript_1582/g.3186  ORF Transcript_1582/g.3186 Transcript_1582/m.3186 type:complete len:208 (-) Transcript_1582:660-1283(-)